MYFGIRLSFSRINSRCKTKIQEKERKKERKIMERGKVEGSLMVLVRRNEGETAETEKVH